MPQTEMCRCHSVTQILHLSADHFLLILISPFPLNIVSLGPLLIYESDVWQAILVLEIALQDPCLFFFFDTCDGANA